MVRLLGFFKSLLKTSKRGEIATLLIVASLAIAAIGAFVGSQQKRTDTTRTNAQGVYPPFPTEEAVDNTDNNPLVTYLETDGDCTVRIRVVRDPGIWVELSNGSGDSTRFYVAQLNGINSSNRSATLDWRPSVPNNQILIRTINPGTSTRYLPRPDWLGRGPTYIRWVYSMKTSPSDPDPRVFYKLQTVNGCRDNTPPTPPPSCSPGSPACPFTPTPTSCTPGSGMPGCPAFTPTPTSCNPNIPGSPCAPTPTCSPGSGMPGCPAFTPTPTVCPAARSAPFIIGYDNTNISEYSIAGTSGTVSWGPLSFAGAQSRSLGGGRKLWFFPHSNIQVPGSMDSNIHLRRNGNNLDNDASIVAFCYTSSEYPVNPNASMPTNVGATNVCTGWYRGVVNVTNRCGSLSTYGWELPRPPVTPTCAPGSGMPGCPRFTPTPTRSDLRNTFQIDLNVSGGQCWSVESRGACTADHDGGTARNCGGGGDTVEWHNTSDNSVTVSCEYYKCSFCAQRCDGDNGGTRQGYRGGVTVPGHSWVSCKGSGTNITITPDNNGGGSDPTRCDWCMGDPDYCRANGGTVQPGRCDVSTDICCNGAGGNNNGVPTRGSRGTPSTDLFTKMDSDGSKNIGVGDFFSWLRAFAAGDTAKCDFNGDGKCRVDDATLMFKYMGTTK